MDSDLAALKHDLEAFVGGLGAHGHDPSVLLAEAGLPDPASLDTVSSGKRDGLMERVWGAAMARYADPLLPFWVGTSVPFGCYELIDYMCAAKATMGEGLQQLGRYLKLITPHMHLEVEGETLTVRPDHGLPEERYVYGLYTTGITLARFRYATGVAFVPRTAELAAPPGLDPKSVEAWLGAPCSFGHSASRFEFDPGTMALPLHRHEPRLLAVLQRHADDLVAQRGLDDDPLKEIRAAVREGLEGGEYALDEVAKRLGMGERTLQRRLADANYGFQQLLDEERKEWSAALLRDKQLAISEVAFLVGYSEQSAFARAFKRWTGHSPSAFRRNTG